MNIPLLRSVIEFLTHCHYISSRETKCRHIHHCRKYQSSSSCILPRHLNRSDQAHVLKKTKNQYKILYVFIKYVLSCTLENHVVK